jgi:hypothetical protein
MGQTKEALAARLIWEMGEVPIITYEKEVDFNE